MGIVRMVKQVDWLNAFSAEAMAGNGIAIIQSFCFSLIFNHLSFDTLF